MAQIFFDQKSGEYGFSIDGKTIEPLGTKDYVQALKKAETLQGQPAGDQVDIKDVVNEPNTGIRFENISPADRAVVKDQFKRAGKGVMLPSARAAELEQTGVVARQASKDPQFLAETQAAGKESLPDLIKTVAGIALPAVLSGGTTALASAGIRGGGLLSRLARATVSGAGGYGAEKATQLAGLSEGDDSTAGLSGGLSAIPGLFRPKSNVVTSAERRIQRLVGGAEAGTEAKTARSTADYLFGVARGGADINTKELLKPIDDVIMREMNTPNANTNIIQRLSNLRDSMSKRILEIQRERSFKVSGQNAIEQGAGVPEKVAEKEVSKRTELSTAEEANRGKSLSKTLTTPFDFLFGKAKSAKVGAEVGGVANIPETKVTGMKIKVGEAPINANPENLVDDLKQLGVMASDAERLGRTDLAKDIRTAYKQAAQHIPVLPEADVVYSQAKGLQRGEKAIRSGGAISVENLLSDPKLSGGLNAAQKEFLRKQAAQSDDIGRVTQTLLKSPLGRSLLRMGVTEKGVVVPTMWNTALQVGARMAGMGQE